MENFLLHPFLVSPASRAALCSQLSGYRTRTWEGGAAILKALLWLGIRESLEENAELVQELWERAGEGASLVLYEYLDCGLLNSETGTTRPFWAEEDSTFDRVWENFSDFASGWKTRERIHQVARNWLSKLDMSGAKAPETQADWEGYCWLLYWAVRLDAKAVMVTGASQAPASWASDLPIDIGAEVHQCVSEIVSTEACQTLRDSILTRYKTELSVFDIRSDDVTARISYLVPVECLDASQLARRHLLILRGLFPSCETYSLDSWGYEKSFEASGRKSGVKRHSLLPKWSVSLNMWLDGLLKLPFRPIDWPQYVERVLELRKALLDSLNEINRGIREHWEEQDEYGVFRTKQLNTLLLSKLENMHGMGSLLPAEVIDRYGRIHESVDRSRLELPAGFPKYQSYLRQLGNMVSSARNLNRQLPFGVLLAASKQISDEYQGQSERHDRVLASCLDLGHSAETPKLAWLNLADLTLRLGPFQRSFRQRFSNVVGEESLAEMDSLERAALDNLVLGACSIATDPNRMNWDLQRSKSERNNRFVTFRKSLKNSLKPLRAYLSSVKVVEVLDDTERAAICVICDLSSPLWADRFESCVLTAIRALIPAFPSEPLEFVSCLFWPNLILVETYNDRLLEPTCRRVPLRFRWETHLTVEEKIELYPPGALPAALASQLQMPSQSVDLTLVSRFKKSWQQVLVQMDRLCGLAGLPELDDEALGLVQQWTHSASTTASRDLQQVFDLMTEMLGVLTDGGFFRNGRPEVRDIVDAMLEYFQEFGDFLSETVRADGTSGSLDFWSDWLAELKTKNDLVDNIRSAWLSLVVPS